MGRLGGWFDSMTYLVYRKIYYQAYVTFVIQIDNGYSYMLCTRQWRPKNHSNKPTVLLVKPLTSFLKFESWTKDDTWEEESYIRQQILPPKIQELVGFIHPWKSSWILKIRQLKRKIIWTNHPFLGFNMLIFRRVSFSFCTCGYLWWRAPIYPPDIPLPRRRA